MSGMGSVRDIYRLGRGPSSSHTIGPERACKKFLEKYPAAEKFVVTLFGSLAKTGKGHGTDVVIVKTLQKPTEVLFDVDTVDLPHPNTMDLVAYAGEKEIGRARALSVGGGAVLLDGEPLDTEGTISEESTFSAIADICSAQNKRLYQYVEEHEEIGFRAYMEEVWDRMQDAIERGIADKGVLPGGLNVAKKAKKLYTSVDQYESSVTRDNRLVCSYAFAVSEQNAAGEPIVTAPTCGSCGVLPAVLYHHKKKYAFSDREIVNALMTAGLIGNLVKTNASISGAECGCQAEVGTACAMAGAALAELFKFDLGIIECSAEICIEHHLGLTCDPICGLVQIPCIERNAVAAMRAINAVNIADFLSKDRKISLDEVIKVMDETGKDISGRYRETSEGGLAKLRI